MVPDDLLAPGWGVVDGGGEESGGFEDFEVALGFPTAPGAVEDGMGLGIPMDFLEGERGAQKVLGEALAALGVSGCDRFFSGVDVKTAVFPGGEFCDFLCADQFGGVQSVEEAVAEEFEDGGQRFVGHGMETALFVEESVVGKDMEMGMKDEVIAEGVDGSCSGKSAIGEAEACAEGIAQALCGGLEEKMEEVPAFAEYTTQYFWEGEDELAVGDCVADGIRDPCAGVSDPALMAGGAEVAGFASECVARLFRFSFRCPLQ